MTLVQRQDYVPTTAVHLPPLKGQQSASASTHAVARQAVQSLSNHSASAVAGAVGGASQVSGNDIQAVLASLVALLTKLLQLVVQMVQQRGGGGVVQQSPAQSAPVQSAPIAQTTQTAQAAPAVAATTSTSSNSQSYEQRVLQLVNQQRAAYGLSPVTMNTVLQQVANKHNATQIESRTMAHIGVGDGDPGARFRAEGFYGSWGENVAVGQSTPEQVVAEWMASPMHRANILNANFHQIGISYDRTQDGFSMWAQEFGA